MLVFAVEPDYLLFKGFPAFSSDSLRSGHGQDVLFQLEESLAGMTPAS
jgi:hypothetical protein